MRILFCIDSLKAGGTERQLVQFLSELQNDINFNIELICLDLENQYSETEKFKFKVHYIQRKGKLNIKVYFRLRRILREFNPDIIHSWSTLSTFLFVPFRIFTKRFKLIDGSVRGSIPIENDKALRRMIRRINFFVADIIVANSNAGITNLRIKGKKSITIHNGISLNRFENLRNPLVVKKELNIENEFIIGMVANFSEYKDHETFFKAAQKILLTNRAIKFLLIGSGTKLKHFESVIIPDFRDNFLFMGRKTSVEEIVNIFDIAVLTTFYEGTPNVVLEYMALYKPIVVSGDIGLEEIIRNDEDGFILKTGDIDGVYNKIMILMNDEKLRQSMGNNAFQKVVSNFSFQGMYKNTLNLYQSILY